MPVAKARGMPCNNNNNNNNNNKTTKKPTIGTIWQRGQIVSQVDALESSWTLLNQIEVWGQLHGDLLMCSCRLCLLSGVSQSSFVYSNPAAGFHATGPRKQNSVVGLPVWTRMWRKRVASCHVTWLSQSEQHARSTHFVFGQRPVALFKSLSPACFWPETCGIVQVFVTSLLWMRCSLGFIQRYLLASAGEFSFIESNCKSVSVVWKTNGGRPHGLRHWYYWYPLLILLLSLILSVCLWWLC